MRRGNWGLLLPGLVLLAAALAYIGVYALGRTRTPAEAALVEEYLWRDGASLTGPVLRTERTVSSPRRTWRITAVPGARVAAGEVLGVAYDTGEDYFRAALLLRLRGELAARTGESHSPGDLRESAAAFTRALAKGDLTALAGAGAELSPRPGERDAGLLEREIADLEAAGAEAGLLTAPASGFFLPAPCEQEALTPAMAGTLTYDQLTAAAQSAPRPGDGAGRLVTGGDWVFAALTDPDTAARFTPREPAALTLAGEAVDARVLRVIDAPEGAAVLFRCLTGLEAVLEARTATLEAEFDRQRGLLVPAGAVHTGEDGETYVRRLAGTLPQREDVTVLMELAEGVLVESETLRAGERVLLDAGDNS